MRSLTEREVSRTMLRKTSLPLMRRARNWGKNMLMPPFRQNAECGDKPIFSYNGYNGSCSRRGAVSQRKPLKVLSFSASWRLCGRTLSHVILFISEIFYNLLAKRRQGKLLRFNMDLKPHFPAGTGRDRTDYRNRNPFQEMEEAVLT